MYHDLPRAARFWSFLFAIDQDLAETARKMCWFSVNGTDRLAL